MDGRTRLRISLLGELTASYDGAALDLGGRRQRAVLALLVLARGDVVHAERLAESVWGGHPPANTAGALQSYVSHLRRRLEPGSAARARSAVIVREGPGYAVRLPPDAVDAWRFESLLQEPAGPPARAAATLRDALDLWTGPALAEYADEPWAQAEIARLTELRRVARERLLGARLEVGEAALLVPELEAMVAAEPLREERWRLLALALYRAHRQGDALATLRRARERLADELGVDPGPALKELEAAVLAQSPALVPQRPTAAVPSHPSAPTRPDDLVERDRELAALAEALDAVAAGQARLLLVEGPAGIGKSRLLAEARRLAAARSVQVLTGRGSQLEQSFAFGVVRQLFEPRLARPGGAELLGGAAASARGVFDLGHDVDSHPSGSHPAGSHPAGGHPAGGHPVEGHRLDSSFAVLHGLYWLAVGIASSGPLVLVVDDLQWCDSASQRFIGYLARRLDAVPVLLVAAVRTGEEHRVQDLLAELALEPAAQVLRPVPLSPEATAEIVERRLGARPAPLFAAACHRTTSGNPLLLRQLLRALEADAVSPDASHADVVLAVGSRAVSSMVLLRMRRLDPDAVEIARAAAVLGDGAPLPAVASLAGLSEQRTATGLAALARAEIVKDEQPLAFAHHVVRDAVYRDLPAAERGLRHERAAAVLRAARASDEQVAAHLLVAPPRGDDATVALLRAAARTAAGRGASDSAVTYLRRALAEPPPQERRHDVLLELGMLESLLDGPAAVQRLQQAYERQDDPRVRAEIAVALARTHIFASPPGVATAFARQAAAAVPAELPDYRQALTALQRISGFMHGLDPALWRDEPAPAVDGRGDGARMMAATLCCEETLAGADRGRAVALARFALEDDRLLAVDDGLFWIFAAAVRMLSDDDLGDFWSRAQAAGHARGSLFTAMSTSVWEGFWRWRRGELHEALDCLALALERVRMWGGGVAEVYARAYQIGVLVDRGDIPAARAAADAAAGAPPAGDGTRLLQQAVARLLVAEGRHEEALATLAAVPVPVPIANPVWNPWRSVAVGALDGLGRTAEAEQLAVEEVALLRRWGAPSFLGSGLRLLGEVRGRAGLEQLREAVEVLAPTPVAVELARARFALGSSPQVGDDEAVPLLLAACEAAQACGALGVRDAARAALARRGRQVRTEGDRARPPSPTERRILDLAGAGMDVRDVAQQLFVTPGTVRAVLAAAGQEGARPDPAQPSQVALK